MRQVDNPHISSDINAYTCFIIDSLHTSEIKQLPVEQNKVEFLYI